MKQKYRELLVARRDSLSLLQVEDMSDSVASNLWTVPGFGRAKRIAIYISFGPEVHTDRIIKDLFRLKKHVYTTRIEKPNLILKEIESLENLQTGVLGIRQPAKHLPAAPIEALDMIIMPGLAFDMRGHRIGYGAGYYDRFLAGRSPHTILAALAYEFQIIEHIDVHQRDIPVNYIVTEERVIACR